MFGRRSFLRGVLASAAASTAIIKLATPEEVSALAVGKSVLLGQPEKEPVMPTLYGTGDWTGRVFMEKEDGALEPVGYVRSIQVSCDEIGLDWEGDAVIVPGLMRGSMQFGGPR